MSVYLIGSTCPEGTPARLVSTDGQQVGELVTTSDNPHALGIDLAHYGYVLPYPRPVAHGERVKLHRLEPPAPCPHWCTRCASAPHHDTDAAGALVLVHAGTLTGRGWEATLLRLDRRYPNPATGRDDLAALALTSPRCTLPAALSDLACILDTRPTDTPRQVPPPVYSVS